MLRAIIFSAFAFLSTQALAQAPKVDCLKLMDNSSIDISIRPANSHFNCFSPETTAQNTRLQIMGLSLDGGGTGGDYVLQVFEITSSGITSTVATYSSQDGAVVFSAPLQNRQLGFQLIPKNASTLFRKINITTLATNNIVNVTFLVDGDSSPTPPLPVTPTPGSPPPNDGGGGGVTCDRYGFCTQPERVSPASRQELARSQKPTSQIADTTSVCTVSNTPPPQLNRGPKKFDINHSLRAMQFLRNGMLENIVGTEVATAQLMASLFYPNHIYDLKNNGDYLTDQRFGNFFFGATAQVMEYSLDTSIKVGAIVQQWQNHTNPNNPAYNSVSTLVTQTLTAIRDGSNDNPGDSADIAIGFRYARDVWAPSTTADSTDNSCPVPDPQPSPATGPGKNFPASGWEGSTIVFNGLRDCIGNCGRIGEWTKITPPKSIKFDTD